MAVIGSIYLIDALYDFFFKDKDKPLIRFAWFALGAFVGKLIAKFIVWAINF
jgi:hypothetical protein